MTLPAFSFLASTFLITVAFESDVKSHLIILAVFITFIIFFQKVFFSQMLNPC